MIFDLLRYLSIRPISHQGEKQFRGNGKGPSRITGLRLSHVSPERSLLFHISRVAARRNRRNA
jgi:hypothetical protein